MYMHVLCVHTNSQSIRRIGCGPDPHTISSRTRPKHRSWCIFRYLAHWKNSFGISNFQSGYETKKFSSIFLIFSPLFHKHCKCIWKLRWSLHLSVILSTFYMYLCCDFIVKNSMRTIWLNKYIYIHICTEYIYIYIYFPLNNIYFQTVSSHNPRDWNQDVDRLWGASEEWQNIFENAIK